MFQSAFWPRVQGRYYRTSAAVFFKRQFAINGDVPYISFTFDDFPRSAFLAGGAILKHFGLRGTYYASLGLMGKESPTGSMFVDDDLKALVREGHELGCHTFDHCHSAKTRTSVFVNSIVENRLMLAKVLPEASFRTFSYPISAPRAWTKLKASKHFACCRGGGQRFNHGIADLNHLSAYFLEKNRDDAQPVKDIIQQNRRAKGWLILATHDISETPTPFGCTPEFFEEIVKSAVSSGARILPVVEAWKSLRDATSS